MMVSPLLRRMAKVEASQRSGWAPWLSRPVSEWPDEVSALFVCDAEGIPVPSVQVALVHLSDELLEAIARKPA